MQEKQNDKKNRKTVKLPKLENSKIAKNTQAALDTIYTNRKHFAFITLLLIAVMIATAVISYTLEALHPYAITVDNKPICYVDTKDDAELAILAVVKDFSPEDGELKAINTNARLDIEELNLKSIDKSQVVGKNKAISSIKKATTDIGVNEMGLSEPLEIIIASSKTTIEPYIPTPNYEKDDTMLAGESEVKIEGVEGSQEVSTTYTYINGVPIEDDITNTKIIDQGSPATLIKGTLGLPDGADWQTFEGDPVFKDGTELTITASKYIGKVRYKLGGQDLKRGVSCLGLVKAIYAKYGIKLPMSHSGMKKAGVSVSYKNAQKGDIICYRSHVGIYIGDGKMIDATSHAGVSVRSVSKKKLVTVRRVVK